MQYNKESKHNKDNLKNLIKLIYKSAVILFNYNLILFGRFAYADTPKISSSSTLVTTTPIAPAVKLSSVPVILPHTNNKESSVVNMPNLGDADGSANDLIQLKRKLEVERAQIELKRLHNDSNSAGAINSSSNIQDSGPQTIVTGVAINQEGKKIAWLQFADGGALTVNIGSSIGKYIVTDITMNGVQLSYMTGHKHIKTHNIYLKRVYATSEKSKNHSGTSGGNPFFTPSPVVTNANSLSDNDMVPPIIQTK